MEDFYEQGDEPSGSTNRGQFLNSYATGGFCRRAQLHGVSWVTLLGIQFSTQNAHKQDCCSKKLKLKLKLKLSCDWRLVGQSALVSGSHLELMTICFFSVWQLWVSWFAAPSLTRGWVLQQFLLGLARAVTLGSKSRRTHDHILLSNLRLLQPRGPGPRIYILKEEFAPVIAPGTGFPFRHLLRLTGLR
jgi:hypothetical protein